MKHKKTYNILLVIILILSVGTIVLINNTDLFVSLESSAVLLKQYLKVVAFASFSGLVYLWFKKKKEA